MSEPNKNYIYDISSSNKKEEAGYFEPIRPKIDFSVLDEKGKNKIVRLILKRAAIN